LFRREEEVPLPPAVMKVLVFPVETLVEMKKKTIKNEVVYF